MQTELGFDEATIRQHLRQCQIPRLQVELVICVRARGSRHRAGDDELYDWQVSKVNGGKAIGGSANGFRDATRGLQQRGLMRVNELTTPFTYRLNWSRTRLLEPPDDWGDFDSTWEPESAGGGQSGSVSLRVRVKDTSVSRVPCNRVRVSTEQLLTLTDSTAPWSELTDEHLALIASDEEAFLDVLRVLKRESQRCPDVQWLADLTHESSRKFLAIAHHAATSRLGSWTRQGTPPENRRVAILTSRVKRMDFGRLQQASWDWASNVLARRARTQATAEVQELAGALRV